MSYFSVVAVVEGAKENVDEYRNGGHPVGFAVACSLGGGALKGVIVPRGFFAKKKIILSRNTKAFALPNASTSLTPQRRN